VLKHDPAAFYERFAEVLRTIRGVGDEAYGALGIGSTQAKFLRHIGANSQISQAELARATNTWPTLTGRAVEALIERGWVRRKRDTADKRQYVLELTPSGKRLRDRVNHARNGVIEHLARVLDEKDAEDFDRIATKIVAAFGTSAATNRE
jgi:DNA-binding MarR family transcriptional regulator